MSVGEYQQGFPGCCLTSEATSRRMSQRRLGYKDSEETRRKKSESGKIAQNRPERRALTTRMNNREWNNPNSGFHSRSRSVKLRKHRLNQVFPLKNTGIEVKTAEMLRRLGVEFEQHRVIRDIEHRYQCDFFISWVGLVIECDGDYWHNWPEGREIDRVRTEEMREKCYQVLRFWEHDINARPGWVEEQILGVLGE